MTDEHLIRRGEQLASQQKVMGAWDCTTLAWRMMEEMAVIMANRVMEVAS